MTTEHVEVERKFEADETFSLPDLTGVGEVAAVGDPEEQSLEATYYDTPDLRLLRSRVTLRRRTGGADAGWHVKLPAAGGARRELHQPVGIRLRRGEAGQVLRPLQRIVAQATADLDRVVAQIRESQLHEPSTVVHGRGEAFEHFGLDPLVSSDVCHK